MACVRFLFGKKELATIRPPALKSHMHSILLLFEPPAPLTSGRGGDRESWREHLEGLTAKAKTLSGCVRLAENLWQIDVPSRLPFLVELLSGAEKWKIPYRTLQLDEGQKWISPNYA
jgi:hypothetical protein